MKPYFDDLAEAGEDLHLPEPGQHVEVRDDRRRRVEGPDEVLALARVDRRLAADRGVDHAEQRGRDLDDAHAAQPGGGDEPGEVGRRSPAEADDDIRCG